MLRAIPGDESTSTPSKSNRTADDVGGPLVTHHEDRAGGEQRDAEHLRPSYRLLVETEHSEAIENDRQPKLARDDRGDPGG